MTTKLTFEKKSVFLAEFPHFQYLFVVSVNLPMVH